MPSVSACPPRKIFPPPITIAISTPCSATDLISSQYCSSIEGLMFVLLDDPCNDSPLSLSKIRLYLTIGFFRSFSSFEPISAGLSIQCLFIKSCKYRDLIKLRGIKFNQHLIFFNPFAHANFYRTDDGITGCLDYILHFHGLKDKQRIPCLDVIAILHFQVDDQSRHGRAHMIDLCCSIRIHAHFFQQQVELVFQINRILFPVHFYCKLPPGGIDLYNLSPVAAGIQKDVKVFGGDSTDVQRNRLAVHDESIGGCDNFKGPIVYTGTVHVLKSRILRLNSY